MNDAVERGARPRPGCVRPGRAHDLEIQRDERRDGAHPGLLREAAERNGIARVRRDVTLNPPDASRVNWPSWPENIDPITDTYTRMNTTSANMPSVIEVRKRRASGYARPSRTCSERLRDPTDRVTDRALLLRHEHDRGADEHQTLGDEEEHADAAVQRERDRAPRSRPRASTRTASVVVTVRRGKFRASAGPIPANTSTGPITTPTNDPPVTPRPVRSRPTAASASPP